MLSRLLCVPNWLYKYTSHERALSVLSEGKVYFPNRGELNDPFDCKFVLDLSTPEKRKKIIEYNNAKVEQMKRENRDTSMLLPKSQSREYQRRIIEDDELAMQVSQQLALDFDAANIGIYCFSEINDSVVMWAHYADNHRGCCLMFDFRGHIYQSVEHGRDCFPFTFINMVRYKDKYPMLGLGNSHQMVPHEPGSVHSVKSKDWQYEKEWRAIMYDTSVKTPITGMDFGESKDPVLSESQGAGFYQLKEGLLDGVILGCKMTDVKKQQIIDAARRRKTKIYQSSPKSYEYGMEIELL